MLIYLEFGIIETYTENKNMEVYVMATRTITVTCPHCGSEDVTKQGQKMENRFTYAKIQIVRRNISQSRTPIRVATRT